MQPSARRRGPTDPHQAWLDAVASPPTWRIRRGGQASTTDRLRLPVPARAGAGAARCARESDRRGRGRRTPGVGRQGARRERDRRRREPHLDRHRGGGPRPRSRRRRRRRHGPRGRGAGGPAARDQQGRQRSRICAAIGTLGFRGEALPSIASVSRFVLVTRSAEDDGRDGIKIEGGAPLETSRWRHRSARRIEVRDLFWNVPARLKFLKTDQTETQHVVELVKSFALGYPHIHFRLGTSARVALDFPSVPAPRRARRPGARQLRRQSTCSRSRSTSEYAGRAPDPRDRRRQFARGEGDADRDDDLRQWAAREGPDHGACGRQRVRLGPRARPLPAGGPLGSHRPRRGRRQRAPDQGRGSLSSAAGRARRGHAGHPEHARAAAVDRRSGAAARARRRSGRAVADDRAPRLRRPRRSSSLRRREPGRGGRAPSIPDGEPRFGHLAVGERSAREREGREHDAAPTHRTELRFAGSSLPVAGRPPDGHDRGPGAEVRAGPSGLRLVVGQPVRAFGWTSQFNRFGGRALASPRSRPGHDGRRGTGRPRGVRAIGALRARYARRARWRCRCPCLAAAALAGAPRTSKIVAQRNRSAPRLPGDASGSSPSAVGPTSCSACPCGDRGEPPRSRRAGRRSRQGRPSEACDPGLLDEAGRAAR